MTLHRAWLAATIASLALTAPAGAETVLTATHLPNWNSARGLGVPARPVQDPVAEHDVRDRQADGALGQGAEDEGPDARVDPGRADRGDHGQRLLVIVRQ